MSRKPEDPLEGLELEHHFGPFFVRYLRWGSRHPSLVTLLWLGMTALLFVVFWQLFGLIVGVIALAVALVTQGGLWLSWRTSTRHR